MGLRATTGRVLAVALLAVALAVSAGLDAVAKSGPATVRHQSAANGVAVAGRSPARAGPIVPVHGATSPATSAPGPPAPAIPAGPVALAGCPPPPSPPGRPAPGPPWHPPVLVPEPALPAPPPPAPRLPSPAALSGKGLWIWQLPATEHGDVAAIVSKATQAGLHQLWVRVADSRDGFYAPSQLAALVPAAHRAGLAVIGWGFPYLYDPVADAVWTQQALGWRGPDGGRLDGFAADIETPSEGTALSARRAVTYLGFARPAAQGRPLVATVFPPTNHNLSTMPYAAMAPYVDAFAPMMYWGCTDPGAYAQLALANLGTLAPVHLIGQAYNMADEGGRPASPSSAEILRFLAVARSGGAVGASLWSWQEMTGEEYGALASFPWAGG
ncbi:MAG TPA: hypothetical protein VH112_00320 [Acidimicrobiales bacterium]|nr:hypothetical protein [Acidimicrobiales bacterium]